MCLFVCVCAVYRKPQRVHTPARGCRVFGTLPHPSHVSRVLETTWAFGVVVRAAGRGEPCVCVCFVPVRTHVGEEVATHRCWPRGKTKKKREICSPHGHLSAGLETHTHGTHGTYGQMARTDTHALISHSLPHTASRRQDKGRDSGTCQPHTLAPRHGLLEKVDRGSAFGRLQPRTGDRVCPFSTGSRSSSSSSVCMVTRGNKRDHPACVCSSPAPANE